MIIDCAYYRDGHRQHVGPMSIEDAARCKEMLVNEEVAAQRDLLATVLEANMAVISAEQTKVGVRQNATIEQLTIPCVALFIWFKRQRAARQPT